MKILLFTDSLGAGGAQRQLVGLACMLKNNGYQVSVVTYYSFDFYKHILDSNGIDNTVIPEAISALNRIFKVRKYIKSCAPDWVIAYQETPSFIACVAKLLGCKVKLLVSERNTTQIITFKDRVRFLLYRVADKIVPNSYTQAEFLLGNYPWMKNKLRTITNFVDLNKFNYNVKNLNVPPLIIVVSSIWPPKNTIGMIEAVRVLASLDYRFRVEWYGLVEGQEKYVKQCVDLISEYEISEYIKLLPKVKNIEDKYKECDFFCLPSFYEGTPNVICEAIATGRPVICSDVCDNSIYVREGVNGFLFNPKDCDELVHSLIKAFKLDPNEYMKMSENSRMIAENILGETVFFNKYNDILTQD